MPSSYRNRWRIVDPNTGRWLFKYGVWLAHPDHPIHDLDQWWVKEEWAAARFVRKMDARLVRNLVALVTGIRGEIEDLEALDGER